MESAQKNQHYSINNRELVAVLWRYIRPYRGRFFASTFVRLAGELTFTANPYLYAKMIALVASGAPLASTYIYFGLWGISSVIRVVGQKSGRLLANYVNEKAAIDAEHNGIGELVKWPLVAHEAEDAGNKIKRIQKGAEGIQRILRLWQDQWILVLSHITSMIIVVAATNYKIGLLLVAFLISYYLISHPILSRAKRLAWKVSRQEEEVGGFVFEIVNNIRTTKVMNLYPYLKERLHKLTEELFERIKKRIAAYNGFGAIVVGTYAQIVRLMFVGFLIYGVIHGYYQLNFLIFFIMYFGNIRDSTDQLTESIEEFAIARHGVARFENLRKIASLAPTPGAMPFPENWRELTIKNLSFSYGQNNVFSNLNLTIKRGQRLGIVGISGAGKSTLFKLLLKEHQDFGGDILIDGISIRDIDPKSFAKFTAVVLQDTEVFNLSLRENIVLSVSNELQTEERLQKALTVSHVREFLNKLPNGADTLIGEKGVKLSGGERQRLGLARAVFKEPQILFLDEATSHLDVESEDKIRDSLHKFFKEVTAVVIAHRLTTIKEMDKILVIDNGRIIEEGSFNELYASEGRFFDLWEKQKL